MGGSAAPIAMMALAMVCAGGLAWALLAPYLSGQARAEKRMRSVRGAAQPAAPRRREQDEVQRRRKQVQETLSEIEARQKERRRPPLRIRIQQAGLEWSPRTFVVLSVFAGVVVAFASMLAGMPLLVTLAFAVVGGVGLPHWLLKFLTARRMNRFLEEFPNAIDIVVRGVKAGLPLNDCLRLVAAECQEPVRAEFGHMLEAQAVGLSMAECVERMYDRIPLAEVNFFSIVITIQQRSGGNLAEALGNLSRVLRDRRRMKAKIVAMSQEAKASAAIIGALPLIVMMLVFLTSPDYISLLWTEPVGQLMLAVSGAWMVCGVLIMRKMINFDF